MAAFKLSSKLSSAILVSILNIGHASAGNVCASAPYSSFTQLSKYPQAEAYCSSHYPVAPVTSTSTAPASVKTVTVATTTLPTTVSVATITIIVTTITSTETDSTTETDTATETVTANGNGKRAKTTPLGSVFTSCTKKGGGFVSTVCSCIKAPKTTTKTVTPTSTSSVTKTIFSSVTSTTTLSVTATETTTTTSTETTTTTTTTTVTPTCTNTQTDNNNCGTCGHVCSSGSACYQGVCNQISDCTSIGDFCDGSGNGDPTCQCYPNTDGGGTCAINGGGCGAACNTSDDCGGLACLAVGCGFNDGNTCELPDDYNTCGHTTTPKFLFARMPRPRREEIKKREE